jgi:hypothetical protein
MQWNETMVYYVHTNSEAVSELELRTGGLDLVSGSMEPYDRWTFETFHKSLYDTYACETLCDDDPATIDVIIVPTGSLAQDGTKALNGFAYSYNGDSRSLAQPCLNTIFIDLKGADGNDRDNPHTLSHEIAHLLMSPLYREMPDGHDPSPFNILSAPLDESRFDVSSSTAPGCEEEEGECPYGRKRLHPAQVRYIRDDNPDPLAPDLLVPAR